MARHNDLGILGERLAIEYLMEKGYVILKRNFRFEKHEIDIIAKHKQFLVVYGGAENQAALSAHPRESGTGHDCHERCF